jgi:hypothetical protein
MERYRRVEKQEGGEILIKSTIKARHRPKDVF